MTKFRVGDLIQFRHAIHVTRLIVEVRETGYTFTMPNSIWDKTGHYTEDSTDPLLEDGWSLVDEDN